MYIYMYLHIYISIFHIYMYMYIYTYICIYMGCPGNDSFLRATLLIHKSHTRTTWLICMSGITHLHVWRGSNRRRGCSWNPWPPRLMRASHHISMSHGSYMNESWLEYELRLILHIWMSRITHSKWDWHTESQDSESHHSHRVKLQRVKYYTRTHTHTHTHTHTVKS